jgi:hypothetical protein
MHPGSALIRQTGTHFLPTFLSSKIYLDFSREDQFEFSYDELLRDLHGAPLFVKPPVANNPFTPVSGALPEKTGDGVRQVMEAVVAVFESSSNELIHYGTALGKAPMSRIMFDIFLDEAISKGLVTRTISGFLQLSARGKHYAVEHKLIQT